MAKLWDDIAKTIREGVDTVVEKTEELTKIGRIKVDIFNIKRNIDRNFSEMGGRVYHLLVEEKQTQISKDKEVKELVDCVKILENELREKKSDLAKIRSKEEDTKPAPAPKKSKSTSTSRAKSTKAGRSSTKKTSEPAKA
ncbi:MAG: hypothetical protein ACE5IR_20655 [bacterium]